MFYIFDNSKFPIVKLTFSRSPNNEEELDNLYEKWYEYYDRKVNMIFIIDVSQVNSIPLKFVNSIVEFGRNIKKLPPYIILTIFYFKSDLLKNIFNVVLSLESPIKPVIITKEVDVVNDVLNGNIEFVNVKDYSIKYPINMQFEDVVNMIKIF